MSRALDRWHNPMEWRRHIELCRPNNLIFQISGEIEGNAAILAAGTKKSYVLLCLDPLSEDHHVVGDDFQKHVAPP